LGVTYTPDEASCRRACVADVRCTGYTWVKPAAGNGPCYPKNACDANALENETPRADLFSGVIASSCKDVICGGKKVKTKPGSCIEPMPEPSHMPHYLRQAAALEQKRAMQQLLCPVGSDACYLGSLWNSGYECVNLQEELERCGSCDNDCTKKPGVSAVTCREGQCIVQACAPTFALVGTEKGRECKPASGSSARRRRRV